MTYKQTDPPRGAQRVGNVECFGRQIDNPEHTPKTPDMQLVGFISKRHRISPTIARIVCELQRYGGANGCA